MIRTLNAIAIAAAAFAWPMSPGLAANACQPMTLTSDNTGRSVDYVDVAADGVNKGDVRIGTRRLLDEGGQVVGYRRWVTVALDDPADPDGKSEAFSSLVLNLPDGQLHVQTLADTSRSIDDTQASLLTPEDTGVVLGGTGAYEFARGSYTSFRDGEQRTYKLNIRCD